MKNYLTKSLNYLDKDVTNICDDLSLWAAPFGTLLLDNFPIKAYKNYLDIGCGTGFPLLEIAARIGSDCNSVGIDPWLAAIERAKYKKDILELNHIDIIEGNAEKITFPTNYFDLITSNLGLNNFEQPSKILSETFRVLMKGGTFCATTNLMGTFEEFYKIFVETLSDLKLDKYNKTLEHHINHRGTEETITKLIEDNGFDIVKIIKSEYQMRFYNGTAFLNHPFIIIAFLDSWKLVLNDSDRPMFFDEFEKRLNCYSLKRREFKLTIPMLYIEATKA